MNLKYLNDNPNRIFLIDGLGALLTGTLLVFLIAPLELYFGMPVNVTYILAGIAFLFVVYSLSSFLFNAPLKPFLVIIMILNVLYCGITLGLIVYFSHLIKTLGILYFVGEIIIVLTLVWIERGVYLKSFKESLYEVT